MQRWKTLKANPLRGDRIIIYDFKSCKHGCDSEWCSLPFYSKSKTDIKSNHIGKSFEQTHS